MNLILYDSQCPLCQRAIHFILQKDKKKHFLFAPLSGKTARRYTLHLKDFDTLVLIQNFKAQEKVLIEGKAVLRICFFLGGAYTLLGLLSFLPSFLADALYRFVAKRRYRLFKTQLPLHPEQYPNRFLE